MAVELASGYVSLVPSTKGFGSALDKQIGPEVDKSAQKAGGRAGDEFSSSFGSGLGKIAAVASAAFAGIQIGGFVKDSIGSASDLNETLSKVGVVLGQDVLPQVDEFAKGAAGALGQSRQSALDAAATFGVFGKSAGLTGKPLADFSTQMVTLSSDLASFSNTSPEDAITAISAALRGESEPIRQYGVLLDEATLQQRALKLGLITTTKQALTPQQRVLAAQAEILAQTTDAQGDFARTSAGLANQQRILSAALKNTKTTIGQAFLPAALQAVTFLTTKALPVFTRVGTAAAEKLGPGLVKLGKIVENGLAFVYFRIFDFVKIVTPLFKEFGALFGDVAKTFGGSSGGFLPTLQEVTAKATNLLSRFVTDAVGFLEDVRTGFDDFVLGFKNGAKGIDDSGLEGKLAGLGDKLGGLVKLVDDHKDVFGPITAAVAGLAAALVVTSKVSPVLSTLSGGLSSLGTVIGILTSPLGIIVGLIAGLGVAAFIAYKKFTPFKAAVDSVAQTFKQSGFGAAVEEAGTQFGRLFEIVKPKLIEFRDKAFQWLKDHGPEIFAGVGTAIGGIFSFVGTEVLTPLGDWIKNTAAPWLKDKITTEWGPAFFDWVRDTAIPMTLAKLPEFVDAITQWIKDHKQEIAAATGTIADATVDWIENIAIPALQERLPGIIATLTDFFVRNIEPLGRQIGSLLMDMLFEGIVQHLPDLALKIPGELAVLGVAMLAGLAAGIIGPDGVAIFEQIATNIIAFVSGLPSRIKDAAVGMWDGLYDAFKSAINLIIGAWNGLEFTVGSFSIAGKEVFGGVTIGTPDIPELAGGGVFNSPFTGMLKLAETPAARPEIVTPQKLLAATFRKELATVGAGGGGGGVHFGDIVVNGAQASPQSIADAVFAKAGWLHFTGRRER